jgi:hypothetical protein
MMLLEDPPVKKHIIELNTSTEVDVSLNFLLHPPTSGGSITGGTSSMVGVENCRGVTIDGKRIEDPSNK